MLTIRTGSRLHFGLLSVGQSTDDRDERIYGGIGVMVDSPGVEITLSAAKAFSAQGPGCKRVEEFALRWAWFDQVSARDFTTLDTRAELDEQTRASLLEKLPVQISVQELPPRHSGFGSGTQLGLSVATGLQSWFERPSLSPFDLAMATGRGKRSAVGTHGFCMGGLIVDRGKRKGEPLSPLACQIQVPETWRVVVLCPEIDHHMHGTKEVLAFRELDPVPENLKSQLEQELNHGMVPAATLGDFGKFSDSLGRYSELAGSCFAAIQGGCFNGPAIEALVASARELGFSGVGQSSWGPATFVWTPDLESAQNVSEELKSRHNLRESQVWVTQPRRTGVSLNWTQDAAPS